MSRVYLDGIFDLFHRGHLESFKKSLNYGDVLVIGVTSDKDASNYKRIPIINENDRVEIIKNCKLVNEVIFPAPLNCTKEFIEKHNIDIVVHGFSSKADIEKQRDYYKDPMDMGIFHMIDYYKHDSTTRIIERIHQLK